MSTIQAIFNDIYEGKAVTVYVGDWARFETLRTQLVKKNTFMNAFDTDSLSLVGVFDKETGNATFTRAKSRKKLRENSWQIVSSSDVLGTVESESNGEGK